MEVTKANFDPKIFREAIEEADFVGFDCEFSGLDLSKDDRKHKFDTTEEVYLKMKDK